MTWHDLSANWSAVLERLRARFPRLDPAALGEPPRDSRVLTAHLAQAHDLTLEEAREELQDFMSVEDLARQSSDLRAG